MLKQIRSFLAVVDAGSFTEAAERCFLSQSAISQQIAALERDLGVELMHRERRRITLTPAGEYLYQHGRGLVEQAEELRREVIRIGQDGEVHLRIGYLDGYDGPALRETILEFASRCPEVQLALTKYSHEDLFQRITANELDLVLSYQRRAFSTEYCNHHLLHVPCVVELPARFPLAQQETVSPDDLQALPCILVARRGQEDLERSFFHDVLGIGREYCFVESVDDARLNVLGGRGFLPLPDLRGDADHDRGIRRLPVLRTGSEPIRFNFCAFWKRARSSGWIEAFITLLTEKIRSSTI